MKPTPEGLSDETPFSRHGGRLELPSEPPGADLIANSPLVSLYIQENEQFININDSGYATVGTSATTNYALVAYYENNYIVVANGPYKNYYLSYNDNYYVAAYYAWRNASYWAVDPVDCSPYPGLYPYYDDGVNYVCCNGVEDAIDKIVTVVAY